MLFDNYINEEAEELTAPVDDSEDTELDVAAAGEVDDPNTPEGIEAIAADVEAIMSESALEAVSYFDGGEEAIKHFTESAEVQALVEARKMSKRTFVRLGKNDDLQRRKNLGALLLAKAHKDPLWSKWSQARVKERKIRKQIYTKYGNKAAIVARKSQQKHIKSSRNLPSLPRITFN